MNMIDPVVQAALEARRNAHAPYSRYSVGAAVETNNGTIVSGANVESSSFALTTCAERIALGAAISRGHRSFTRLAVASKDGATPCGACRQIIWDLCKDIPITLVDEEGQERTVRSKDLLPHPFDDRSLAREPPEGQ